MRDQIETYRTQSFWSDPGRWAPQVVRRMRASRDASMTKMAGSR